MKRHHTAAAAAALGALLLGCPSDDATSDTNVDTSSESGTSPTTTTPTTTTPTTTEPTTTEPTTTADTTADTTDTTPTTEESSSTTVDPSVFEFNDTPPDQYVRVDRMGFPAVNTGLHIHGDKDAYNAASPEEDVGTFFEASEGEAGDSLFLLHRGPDFATGLPSGLDDEINGLFVAGGFPTGQDCEDAGGVQDCLDQAGPLVYPDTLRVSTELPPGFSIDPTTCAPIANGRGLDNPVIDIILAALLIDLGLPAFPEDAPIGFQCDPECVPGGGECIRARATTFLNLPGGLFEPPYPEEAFSLNPIQNDVEFQADFPYLAAAHTP